MPYGGATETTELEMMPLYLAKERMLNTGKVLRRGTGNAAPDGDPVQGGAYPDTAEIPVLHPAQTELNLTLKGKPDR